MSVRGSPASSSLRRSEAEVNMANPPSRLRHITPRNSDVDEASGASIPKETPYGTLRQLANMPPRPTTPLRRASSAGPPSARRSIRRTPSAQTRTPGAAPRLGGSVRRATVLTPHGRAAIREVEARRAGFTPGKDRRRSGRQQRETPRDALRLLSRALAPKSQPMAYTPTEPAIPTGKVGLRGQDEFDDDFDVVRPRLSLPLEEEDEDDFLQPPRSAGLEDEDHTLKPVENARRAISEQPLGALSRGSFGSIRTSDAFADLTELEIGGANGEIYDSTVISAGVFMEDDAQEVSGFNNVPEETGTLRGLGFDQGRMSLPSGRDSHGRLTEFPAEDSETHFVFPLPQRDVLGRDQLDESPDLPSEAEGDHEDAVQRDEFRAEKPASQYNHNNSPGIETSILDTTGPGVSAGSTAKRRNTKKMAKISKYGIQYPSLPGGMTKKLATTYAHLGGTSKAKISNETLNAIVQASDWFLEQVSDDLSAYAKHAGRKTIDEHDILTLMSRQRQINATTTPFSLAQKYLPRELLQELRMVPPSKLKSGRHP